MPKVLVLCDIVGRYGGTERYWETVLPELARRYDVRLCARRIEEPDRFGTRPVRVPWSDEFGLPSAEAARAVAAEISSFEPDAVITANVLDPLVLQAVRSRAHRWLARVHDYRPFCPNGNKVYPQFPSVCTERMGAACAVNTVLRGCVRGPRPESFRRIATRLAVRDALLEADIVLVSSGYVRATCAQNGVRLDAIAVTPPPLPDAAFGSESPAHPIQNQVLVAGRLSEEKGLLSLIGALGSIDPQVRPKLAVAGTVDALEHARLLAERSAVAVSWLGWIGARDLRAVIDASRVIAVPSLWPEPFGLVGIEAQARGRPAVAYDVGGVNDWIEGAGIAVRRGDEAALGAALERLTSDGQSWSSYASAARRKAERHRLQRHVENLQALIEGSVMEAARA